MEKFKQYFHITVLGLYALKILITSLFVFTLGIESAEFEVFTYAIPIVIFIMWYQDKKYNFLYYFFYNVVVRSLVIFPSSIAFSLYEVRAISEKTLNNFNWIFLLSLPFMYAFFYNFFRKKSYKKFGISL